MGDIAAGERKLSGEEITDEEIMDEEITDEEQKHAMRI